MKKKLLPELLRGEAGRLAIVLGIGLFLLSCLVTLLVLGARKGGGREEAQAAESGKTAPEEGVSLSWSDFIASYEQPTAPSPPYLLREPLRSWSQEQVKRYWVPLDDIARQMIKKENDRRIEELFSAIP